MICRFKTVLGVVAIALAGFISPAQAQTFEFTPYDADGVRPLDVVEWNYRFNLARCLCDAEYADAGAALQFLRITSPGPYNLDEVYILLGDDCDDPAQSPYDHCLELAVINYSDFVAAQWIALPTHRVVEPLTGICSQQNGGETSVWIIMYDPLNAATAYYVLPFDTQPPGTPQNVGTETGTEAVTVRWEAPQTGDEEVRSYDLLCSVEGSPVAGMTPNPSWLDTFEVCGADLGASWPEASFHCGSVTAGTTELKFEGLSPDGEYAFAVVAVDRHGNPSAVSPWVTATPQAQTPPPSPRPGCSCRQTTPPPPLGLFFFGLLLLFVARRAR